MNILIVEDHPVFRDIIKGILANWFASATVVCATDEATAIRHLQAKVYTHLLLNLQIQETDGFYIADVAVRLMPDIRIIALTSQCDDYTVYRTERRHIRGFVDKRVATAFNFHQAIANVEAELTYYSPSFLRLKAERIINPVSFDKILSDREIEILALIALPLSDGEIATDLGISQGTAEKHRFNILRKLGLSTTTELMRFARKRGIVCSQPYNGNQPPARWNTTGLTPADLNRLPHARLGALSGSLPLIPQS